MGGMARTTSFLDAAMAIPPLWIHEDGSDNKVIRTLGGKLGLTGEVFVGGEGVG
jgi:hypothetical protein